MKVNPGVDGYTIPKPQINGKCCERRKKKTPF